MENAPLPYDIFDLILKSYARMYRFNKNATLPLRLVCRDFEQIISPIVLKTIPLEFSKFLRHGPIPNLFDLDRVAHYIEAAYVDMMVIRDEQEIVRLSDVFQGITQKVPEMGPYFDSLRQYCMSENTFDETDFRRVVEGVLKRAKELIRFKINLPFQVVGHASQTATLLLATTLACIAKRDPLEYKALETLVLDHVSDTSIMAICNNHIDVGNAVTVLSGLKNLVISIKRQESRVETQAAFTKHLWFLLGKAASLESLCLIGWNVKRNMTTRKNINRHTLTMDDWTMRSMPYQVDSPTRVQHLKYLELKRLDIFAISLVSLIQSNASSLKELYLNEVYLKLNTEMQLTHVPLWIGQHGLDKRPWAERSKSAIWIAENLREMEGLNLEVLVATGLGYDDYRPGRSNPGQVAYDLVDPTGLGRSFDQRFVQASMRNEIQHEALSTCIGKSSEVQPEIKIDDFQMSKDLSVQMRNQVDHQLSKDGTLIRPNGHLHPIKYDVVTFQEVHNTTSQFHKCIDGHFYNHNDRALKELQSIIEMADRGMRLIDAEIDRSHAAQVNPDDGTITEP